MKNFLTAAVILTFFLGAAFILFPTGAFSLFGAEPSSLGLMLVRTLGAAVLGFFVVLSYARISTQQDLHKAALRGLFIYLLFSTAFLLVSQLTELFNALGWILVGLHLVFLIWSAPYAFRK